MNGVDKSVTHCTRYYFTRHGESQANVDRVFAGNSESPLTEKGKADATDEAKRLAQGKVEYDLIISSPLERAKDTANIIAVELGYPTARIVTNELLAERSFGDLVGKRWDSIPDEASDLIVTAGGESVTDFASRVQRGLNVIVDLAKDKASVLIVGHGSWFQMAETIIGRANTKEYIEATSLPNNKVVEMQMEGYINGRAAR